MTELEQLHNQAKNHKGRFLGIDLEYLELIDRLRGKLYITALYKKLYLDSLSHAAGHSIYLSHYYLKNGKEINPELVVFFDSIIGYAHIFIETGDLEYFDLPYSESMFGCLKLKNQGFIRYVKIEDGRFMPKYNKKKFLEYFEVIKGIGIHPTTFIYDWTKKELEKHGDFNEA